MILKPTPTPEQIREFFDQAKDAPEHSIDIPEWAQEALLLIVDKMRPPRLLAKILLTTDPGCIQVIKSAFFIGVYAERQGWDTDLRGVSQAERENHG